MSLKDTIKAAAKTAFAAVGDIKTSTTYQSASSGAYDPTLGKRTITTESTTLDAIITDYRAFEIDGDKIQIGDQLITILQESLTVMPSKADSIIANGSTWLVIGYTQDPAGATWAIQTRQE